MASKPVILSLFDYTGEAVRPWAEAGFKCFCLDVQHPRNPPSPPLEHLPGSIHKVFAYLGDGTATLAAINQLMSTFNLSGDDIHFVFGWPPCTDLASSGARHWEKKRREDPEFQTKAVKMARGVEEVATALHCPFLVENPQGALSTLWRKPEYRFDPCDYGGYCPSGPHPRWPEYIPALDAYKKRTCLWTGNGFVMPDPAPVDPVSITVTRRDGTTTSGSPTWAKLGGKSIKTKNIRSATPRGFARAVFEANCPLGFK